jgi:hypothetical protein
VVRVPPGSRLDQAERLQRRKRPPDCLLTALDLVCDACGRGDAPDIALPPVVQLAQYSHQNHILDCVPSLAFVDEYGSRKEQSINQTRAIISR